MIAINHANLGAFSVGPIGSQALLTPDRSAVWLRNLIKPLAGHGLAYIDWIQQEFGIAAALSGDPAMLEAYQSHEGKPSGGTGALQTVRAAAGIATRPFGDA